MASSDIYVRKDVYEADQRALIAEIRLANNEQLKKIEESFNTFKKEIDVRFNAVEKRLDRIETKVEVLTTRVEGVEKRIGDTHNFMMIGFALLGLMIAFMPIARFVKRWWRRPVITVKKVEEMINAKLDVFNQNKTSPLP